MRSLPWVPLQVARSRAQFASKIELIALTGLLVGLHAVVHPVDALDGSEKTTLSFSRNGEPSTAINLSKLGQQIEPSTIRVIDPYEKKAVAFRAFPLPQVLDTVYSPSWREEEEMLFTCHDGYQPTIPVDRILSHSAWLAFDRVDQNDFSILKLESGKLQTIDLSPYYVVWENLEDTQIRMEADYGWPYQLAAIDLVRRRELFRKMAPPADASPEVQKGFAEFRVHCSKCHKLNGEGGQIGPELNPAPASGNYYDSTWLKKWIENPDSVRPNTRMPPLNPDLPHRQRTVKSIIAYLQAMAAITNNREE